MPDTHESSFETVIGTQPTAASQQRLARLKDALRLGSNDALWSILYALEFYQELYEEMPEQITSTAHSLVAELRGSSKALSDTVAAEAKRQLGTAVKEAVAAVSQDVTATNRAVADRKLWEWMALAVVVICVSMGLLSYVMFRKGESAGYAEGSTAGYEAARQREGDDGYKRGRAEGYEAAKADKAAASWANTSEGKLAQEMAKSGALTLVATCSGKGWLRQNGMCYGKSHEDGHYYGWPLPGADAAKERKQQQ